MYRNICPVAGTMPICCCCMMNNRNMSQPGMPMEARTLFSGEELEENRTYKGNPMPPMPGMGQQMPGMMDMSKMDMGKINADTQEIVGMLEQHHPDLFTTLTNCGMSMGQARQYLSRVIEMSLMHYMMHQM